MRWFDDATKRQIQNVTAASNNITLLYPRCSLLLDFGGQQKSDVLIRKTCKTAHLTMQRSIRFKMWNVHWMSWNGRIQVGIACHMVSWTLVSKLMRYMPQSAVTCLVLPTLNMWIEPLKTKHSLWFRVVTRTHTNTHKHTQKKKQEVEQYEQQGEHKTSSDNSSVLTHKQFALSMQSWYACGIIPAS